MTDQRLVDRASVEAVLPAYMLELALRALARWDQGYSYRGDVIILLTRAQEAAFVRAKMDSLSVSRVALRVERDGRDIMKGANTDDYRLLLLGVCRLILRLVDQRRLPDPEDQAILISLMLVEEAERDDEVWGRTAGVDHAADGMLNRAFFQGYYRTQYEPASKNPLHSAKI